MAEETQYIEPEKRISQEEEIRELEQRLEEKKRALAEQEGEMPHEKEMFREVLKEHVEEIQRAHGGSPLPPLSLPTTQGVAPLATPVAGSGEDEAKVRILIEIALTKSIEEAIRIASGETPYLLDRLHDELVDEYYEKLLALRKIETP